MNEYFDEKTEYNVMRKNTEIYQYFYENYEHFKNLIQDDEILNDIEETIKKYRSKDSLERLYIGKDIKEILDPFMIENDIEWLDDETLDEFLKIVMLNPFGGVYWGE